jgi:hypothetical protein
MQTITIDNEWIETAKLFGDVENVIKEALRAYSIKKCEEHINNATTNIAKYAEKYQCDYENLKQAVQTDEGFLMKIEAINPLWEEDAMEWEYWVEEHQTWHNQLEFITIRIN